MLEARQLIGDSELMEKLTKQLNHQRLWPSTIFFEAKRHEQHIRHTKNDHTEYSLEPNLKTSPGGLRDIQTICGVALRHWGVWQFSDMAERGILTESEKNDLESAKQH